MIRGGRRVGAVGIALVAGVTVCAAALSGSVLLGLMWIAEWPLARNVPRRDDRLDQPARRVARDQRLVLVVVALTYAGTTWGLGKRWARLPFVARHPGPCDPVRPPRSAPPA